MPLIHYVEANGAEYEAEVPVGQSVMQGAVDNMIDGILGECGGVCSCATCHCYVDENWLEKISKADDDEESMLDQAMDIKKNSRLSCQIPFTEELNGITLTLAPKF